MIVFNECNQKHILPEVNSYGNLPAIPSAKDQPRMDVLVHKIRSEFI